MRHVGWCTVLKGQTGFKYVIQDADAAAPFFSSARHNMPWLVIDPFHLSHAVNPYHWHFVQSYVTTTTTTTATNAIIDRIATTTTTIQLLWFCWCTCVSLVRGIIENVHNKIMKKCSQVAHHPPPRGPPWIKATRSLLLDDDGWWWWLRRRWWSLLYYYSCLQDACCLFSMKNPCQNSTFLFTHNATTTAATSKKWRMFQQIRHPNIYMTWQHFIIILPVDVFAVATDDVCCCCCSFELLLLLFKVLIRLSSVIQHTWVAPYHSCYFTVGAARAYHLLE